MPFVTTRLTNEPIVMLQFDLDEIDRKGSMRSIQDELDRMASESTGRLYVLIDLRWQDIHYSDILLMIEYAGQNSSGNLSDPRLHTALIGDHPLLSIATRKFNLAFGSDIEYFQSMEDALLWARDILRSLNDQNPS
jgi:hypothetical protein